MTIDSSHGEGAPTRPGVTVLDGRTAEALLTPQVALECLRRLFEFDEDDGSIAYGRTDLRHSDGWLRLLPAVIRPLDVFGFKSLSSALGVGVRYVVYVHELSTGRLMGIVDAQALTNFRTAAVTALATDWMAGPQISRAALVGTGPLAKAHLLALEDVRSPDHTVVFARSPAGREGFVAEMSQQVRGELVAASSLDEAVADAELVTLATSSTTPILERRHVADGIHVNSIGPTGRGRFELSADAFSAFDRVVCDSPDLVITEAGDAVAAAEGGYLDRSRLSSLHELIAMTGDVGRSRKPTLFKSVGTGCQDLVVAREILGRAWAAGLGNVMDDFVSLKPR